MCSLKVLHYSFAAAEPSAHSWHAVAYDHVDHLSGLGHDCYWACRSPSTIVLQVA